MQHMIRMPCPGLYGQSSSRSSMQTETIRETPGLIWSGLRARIPALSQPVLVAPRVFQEISVLIVYRPRWRQSRRRVEPRSTEPIPQVCGLTNCCPAFGLTNGGANLDKCASMAMDPITWVILAWQLVAVGAEWPWADACPVRTPTESPMRTHVCGGGHESRHGEEQSGNKAGFFATRRWPERGDRRCVHKRNNVRGVPRLEFATEQTCKLRPILQSTTTPAFKASPIWRFSADSPVR